MCVRLNRTGCQYFCQPGLHRACPVPSSSAATDSTLVGNLFMSGLGEWWVVGQRRWGGGAVTYCRFRSYSCGGTVIISPLLLNSVILSYIRGARGQEILQFINRATLCNGDYCMAYILTSLFSLKDFFSAVLPRLRLCSVVPYRVLSRGSVTAGHRTRRVTCSVSAYPWRRGGRMIKCPISYDRGLCGWSQKGGGVTASASSLC